jgi:hypothetical protein
MNRRVKSFFLAATRLADWNITAAASSWRSLDARPAPPLARWRDFAGSARANRRRPSAQLSFEATSLNINKNEPKVVVTESCENLSLHPSGSNIHAELMNSVYLKNKGNAVRERRD